jgi:hypothetical protein
MISDGSAWSAGAALSLWEMLGIAKKQRIAQIGILVAGL